MKQVRVLGFQAQVGNEADGWVNFGKRYETVRSANVMANGARRTYVRAETIDTRVIRIVETREVIEEEEVLEP